MYTTDVRTLRKRLKAYLEADAPTLVGDRFHARALIIPIQAKTFWNNRELFHKLAKAKAFMRTLKLDQKDGYHHEENPLP